MNRQNIIVFIIAFIIAFSTTLYITSQYDNAVDDFEDTLERCQDKGWDAVRYESKQSTELICSNYSQAKIDTYEEKEELANIRGEEIK